MRGNGLTKEEAQACNQQIKNYRHLKNQVDELLDQGKR